MSKKENTTAHPTGVQVFELTMDNPEDQDALNRQLKKPSESSKSPSAMRRKVQNKITESPGKKGRTSE